MQKPDARRKNFLRKGFFLLRFSLFQSCRAALIQLVGQLDQYMLGRFGTKTGQMPAVVGYWTWLPQNRTQPISQFAAQLIACHPSGIHFSHVRSKLSVVFLPNANSLYPLLLPTDTFNLHFMNGIKLLLSLSFWLKRRSSSLSSFCRSIFQIDHKIIHSSDNVHFFLIKTVNSTPGKILIKLLLSLVFRALLSILSGPFVKLSYPRMTSSLVQVYRISITHKILLCNFPFSKIVLSLSPYWRYI